jgi:PAS domain S-box-containing protein
VVVFDDARNYVAFNAAYCELTGYTREEILEHGTDGHLVADDGSREGSARLTRKDGAVLPVGYRLIETNVSALPYTIALVWPDE